MLTFVIANKTVLLSILSGGLLIISEVLALTKSPSSAKGIVDGLIKLLQTPTEPPKV